MSEHRASLAEHVVPEVDEARLARQRAAIAARVKARRPWWKWPAFAAPALVLAAVVLVRSHAATTDGAVPGTVVEAPLGAPLPITLLDGSKVVLEAQTKLSLVTLLPKDIRLELAHGSIDLDVTHVDGRAFVVIAAGYEVRVVGTHFTVKLTPEEGVLEVRVARGRVRVTRIGESGDVRVLGAGETWSTAPPTVEPPVEEIEELDAAPETPSPVPTTSGAPIPAGPTAKELWARAESARADRRYPDEAAALNELRLRHRRDPRAGLAAFELGRLRQDTLHDPAHAAEAFADAIALAPNGPFREDAEARRVESLDAAGRRDACVEARAAFLARYPGSIHRQRVSTSCEPR
jgi:transmembrane sensor